MASMKTLTTAELRRELDRREASAGKLQTRRDELLAQIRDLETEIAAITGNKIANRTARGRGRTTPTSAPRTTGRRGPRPKNDVSLAEALVQAAEIGAQLTPKEAASYVLANGYKTTGKKFGVQVATALAKGRAVQAHRAGRVRTREVGAAPELRTGQAPHGEAIARPVLIRATRRLAHGASPSRNTLSPETRWAASEMDLTKTPSCILNATTCSTLHLYQ